MAIGDKSATRTRLTASAAERFSTPARATAAFARRTCFSVTLAAILAVHLGLLALFLRHDEAVAPPAQVAEIPVEVVVQPPPAPEPAAQQPPEKPATSAPRAANDETVDRDTSDLEPHAPKNDVPKNNDASKDVAQSDAPEKNEIQADNKPAAPDPVPPTPPAAASAEPPAQVQPEHPAPDQAKPDKPDSKPEVVQKDAEALDKLLPPEPPKRPADLARAAPPKPSPKSTLRTRPKPQQPSSALQQLAGSSSLPDYTFAKPMRRHAKVTGGSEDDRYLAVVYGMITQHHALGDLPEGDWFVAVAFQVDGDGRLVGVGVQRSSGYPQVDLAALQAVERAAPFPPPPSGATTGLVARLHSGGSARAALDDGER